MCRLSIKGDAWLDPDDEKLYKYLNGLLEECEFRPEDEKIDIEPLSKKDVRTLIEAMDALGDH